MRAPAQFHARARVKIHPVTCRDVTSDLTTESEGRPMLGVFALGLIIGALGGWRAGRRSQRAIAAYEYADTVRKSVPDLYRNAWQRFKDAFGSIFIWALIITIAVMLIKK